jgi:membrane-associated phospholipid phosphatase
MGISPSPRSAGRGSGRGAPLLPPLYAHDPFLPLHQVLQSTWLDLPMAILTTACEGWALALLGASLYAQRERRWRTFAAAFLPLAAALLLSGLAVKELKEVLATPRPLAVYGSAVRLLGEPLLSFGFPSGHASSAAAFAAVTGLLYGGAWHAAWALAVLGGLSRVYVGAHWVTDVVGGWALGATVGMAVYAAALRAHPAGHLAQLRSGRRAARHP